MTEPTSSKTAFAPAWPYVYKVPRRWQVIAPFERVSVFNRGLTAEQLKPLTEEFRPAASRLLKAAAYALISSGVFQLLLVLVTLSLDAIFSVVEVSESTEQRVITSLIAVFNAAPQVIHWASAVALVLLIACGVQYLIAWAKWRTSVIAAWNRHKGRIVPTRGLPGERREKVNALGSRLESAMPALDALNLAHCHLVADATDAIFRYIDLPVLSEERRRVAQSDVQNESVQKVRDEYETAVAAAKAALEHAEDAVAAIEAATGQVRDDAADQHIIGLAENILREPTS
ncbi:hypothetical protein [Arthrobacter sp. UYCo732]|uniref:hypothetical protein n=1 Tax=Arthrobacter sp. UYCo732 TaxID=3156336 RepID=UPI0033985F6D